MIGLGVVAPYQARIVMKGHVSPYRFPWNPIKDRACSVRQLQILRR